LPPRSKPANWYSDKLSGTGVAGMRGAMFAVIQRAAAMREPAHDDLVRRNDLLAIDAEVLPRLVRPARDDQAPGDQRRGVARPAGLHRQARQIDRVALPYHLLAGRGTQHLGRHVEHLLQHRQLFPGVLQSLGRLRFLEIGQQRADFAQAAFPVGVGALFAFPGGNAERHAARCAEQVGQHRDRMSPGLFEEQRRSAGAQHPVGDLGHFQMRINLDRNALEFTQCFQLGDEITQVGIFHGEEPDIIFDSNRPHPILEKSAPATRRRSAPPVGGLSTKVSPPSNPDLPATHDAPRIPFRRRARSRPG
jgi:hypothetical protein